MTTFVIRALLAVLLAISVLAQDKEKPRAQGTEERPARHLLENGTAGNGGAKEPPKLSAREAGTIAQTTGKVLTQGHYRQTPLNDDISRIFFTNYLSTLDYARMVFLQSDIDEFADRYSDKLDDFTRNADAAPAYEIFKRYLTRLEERNAYAQKILGEKLDFSVDERFNPQRDKASWPKDQAEAEELWRLRVKFDVLQGRLAKDKHEDTLKNLAKRYNRLLKTMKDYDDEEILAAYLTAFAHAYDPHSDYMSPSEARQFEISNVKLSLSGIGALLEWEDGYTRIKSLVPGGPAEQSKLLKPKDRIVAVSQSGEEPVDVVEMRLNKVVELIRGKKGSEVQLTIIPGGTEGGVQKTVKLVRDDIKLSEQFAKARVIDYPVSDTKTVKLGVVILPQFYENCARDVAKLIAKLKEEKIEGVVLDLRRNGGGILEEAIELTGLFIKEGPVVQVKNQSGANRVLEDEDSRVAWDGPLIVAVGHLSASASEIVAAALQDYGRALIVGDSTTHGKGTVQTLMPLSQFAGRFSLSANAGKLKFTVSKFYRIAGGTTQKYGVSSDIALPTVLDYMELGESHLPNCLPADRTSPLEFAHLDFVQPYLSTLRDRSANRVASSREFGFILEDIEEMKKRKDDPSVSLNEAKRIAEKNDRKTRDEARKKERLELEKTPIPVHEITLESIENGQPPKLLGVKTPAKDAAKNATASASKPEPAKDQDGAVQVASNAATPEAAKTDADADEETPEEDDGHLDAPLKETLHVLTDYLELLSARGVRLVVDGRSTPSNN